MDRLAFRNALCVLRSIDGWELHATLTPEAARAFMDDPVRFFLRADDPTAEAIWHAIEARFRLSHAIREAL